MIFIKIHTRKNGDCTYDFVMFATLDLKKKFSSNKKPKMILNFEYYVKFIHSLIR